MIGKVNADIMIATRIISALRDGLGMPLHKLFCPTFNAATDY